MEAPAKRAQVNGTMRISGATRDGVNGTVEVISHEELTGSTAASCGPPMARLLGKGARAGTPRQRAQRATQTAGAREATTPGPMDMIHGRLELIMKFGKHKVPDGPIDAELPGRMVELEILRAVDPDPGPEATVMKTAE